MGKPGFTSACRWLPTNRRNFYKDKSPFGRQKCHLCLPGKIENIEHLWICPAVEAERTMFLNLIQEKLTALKFPFARKPNQEERLFNSLVRKTLEGLKGKKAKNISTERVKRLVRDFWDTNEDAKLSSFTSKLSTLIHTCPCLKGVNHSCGQKSIIGLQNELIGMFCQYLALTVEANTSSLGRSILFNEWCSPNENDMAFGSLGAFWKVDLTGKNCLLVCTRNDSVDLKNINDKIQTSVNSKQPTRVLLVIPSELLQEMALPPRKILSIAEISTNFPLTRPEEVEGTSFNASEAYSVILVINQESMLIDPIQWEGFKKALLTWAENNGSDLSIPELTDNLFNERIPLIIVRAQDKGSPLPLSESTIP